MRISRGIYVWRARLTPELMVKAAAMRVPPTAVFSGRTAAWLHGLTVDLREPIEVTLVKGGGISGRAGLAVRRHRLDPDDVVMARGRRTTSICRTLRDVAAKLPLVEAVVMLDLALQAKLTTLDELHSWIATRAGTTGISALRNAARQAEPGAESPMETRLRMLLVLRGLPRPLAQVAIVDSAGIFIGRLDLYYPEERLGLEYDGATHRDSLAEDNRRQNRLLAAGVRLLRFTAADIYSTPDAVAEQVAGVLAGRRAAAQRRSVPA